MPSATVTVRELKNKDTGLDLSIPKTTLVPGLFGKSAEYHVMVVSILPCFKSPKHKEGDVVQYVVKKNLDAFEDLRKKIGTKFPGTVLPSLPKKMLMVEEGSIQDRRQQLEHFLRVIASTPKLATSHVTLEFLGVNPMKAGRFTTEEGIKIKTEKAKALDIFEESEKDEDTGGDLFTQTGQGESETAGYDDDDDDDIFEASSKGLQSVHNTEKAAYSAGNLFEAPDLGGAIDEKERQDFLVPGAADVETSSRLSEQLEDNSDLLNIEDDLDKLLSAKLPVTVTPKEETTKSSKPVKPATGPKPTLAPKPTSGKKVGDTGDQASRSKPTVPVKPAAASKPSPAQKPAASAVSELGTNDILKYIQDNSQGADDDLDLFS